MPNDIDFTDAMDQSIRAACAGYHTFSSLSVNWGVSRHAIRDRASYLGVLSPSWSPEQIEILRIEWEKGTSARDIGKMIDKTRNAVIGKAHRLGLGSRTTVPRSPTRAPKVREIPAAPKIKAPVKTTPDNTAELAKKIGGKKAPVFYRNSTPLEGITPISIMELDYNTCRAPVGHDQKGLVTYCGADVFPGKSFCPSHCALFYAPANKRRRA